MRLGFQTIIWGRRIDDLDHLLSVLVACGFEGVEFGQCHRDIYVRENKHPRPIGTYERLKARLDAHGLTLVGLVGGTLRDRMEFCGEHREPFLYLDSWPEHDWRKAIEMPRPFTLALHPHWFMPIRNISEAERHISSSRSDHVKLIIDTAHAMIAEDDPVEAIKRNFAGLAAVHLKDWRPDFGRWSQRYARGFCHPGDGIVPLNAVMETLVERGYEGWVVLEQDHFENSREQSAFACAQWAEKWSGRGFRNFTPNRGTLEKLERGRLPTPVSRSHEQVTQEFRMAQQLALAPARGPDVFYQLLSGLLKEAFQAEAVKLWSYNPSTDELCIVAAALEAHLPQATKLLHPKEGSLTGSVVEDPRVLTYDLNVSSVANRFADKSFLAALKSRCMIIVPIFNSSNAHHLRYILTIFKNRGTPVKELSDEEKRSAEHYANLVAIWADYLTDEICAAAAGATNHLCGEQRDKVTPFVNAFMEHLERLFKCETATLFLVDETRSRLEPAGKTNDRIVWDSKLPQSEWFYRKGEGLTGGTWERREMLFCTDATRAKGHVGKSFEKTKFDRRELLTAPLARRGGDVLGVVRLHNKLPLNRCAATAFTDDDAARLDAIVQAALPHLDLLIDQQRRGFAVTRLTHELRNPLVGIAAAVEALKDRIEAEVPNNIQLRLTLGYLDDIADYHQLMVGLVGTANLFGSATLKKLAPRLEQTDLLAEVIQPIWTQSRALLKQHKVTSSQINFAGFVLPPLSVDRHMFQQVFFNLFMNAIRYHDHQRPFEIAVKGRRQTDKAAPDFVIEIEDWGIGLDKNNDLGESLFLPGIRGQNASRQHAGGTGVGLAVVQNVIDAHGGTIRFSNPRSPTRIEILLPASLGDDNHSLSVHPFNS